MAVSLGRALISCKNLHYALRTASISTQRTSVADSSHSGNPHESAVSDRFPSSPAAIFYQFNTQRGFTKGRNPQIKEDEEDEDEKEVEKEEDVKVVSKSSEAVKHSIRSARQKKALAGLRRINLEGLRWRVFDAKGQVLGRLASHISTVVQGKDKPTYTPHREEGDMCIIINAKDVCVTGRKMTDKFYRWHTGYIGHLKERSLKDQMAKDPTEVIRKAVMRMLPRNKLRDDRDRKLRIFADVDHPFGDRLLEPYVMPNRQVRELRPRARRAMIRAQKKAEQQEQGTSNTRKGKRREEVGAEIST
ncbi:hypothetical protein OROHE_027222 [Orobanche hederae]